MPWIVKNLWLIPALPMLAAGLSALAPRRFRKFSASLAIGSMIVSFLLALCAFSHTLGHHGDEARQVFNFTWLRFAAGEPGVLKLGWVLDPLTAVMLVMVTFVGTLIFIYSLGYMAHDDNFTRFFTFLSLFAGAMLGVVIANSLVLLFISWELVGLTSYLLIGFWFHKPSAVAAAKKAFITTRIGDVLFLLGMVWLYSQSGTLLFYDGGHGCLEQSSLAKLLAQTTSAGFAVSTAIGLLIFAGAAGKSGQVPLHVWLPDAMEGPTPVSALIHAATMVAAGVFLVARVYPLMSAAPPQTFVYPATHVQAAAIGHPDAPKTLANNPEVLRLRKEMGYGEGGKPLLSERKPDPSVALKVVTWIGAITAIFAASIAVAQNDIKRILAYSTVSQLGYMMMGLGVGGVAVGMFHLITHAFFKALLFMGAGSVIHGCHDEQDIRRMGGLKKYMPITFATYAIGMLALAGFPLLFSGFWSKDEILHSAHNWPVSHVPFYLGLIGALLTAFYMTRQVALVFFGKNRAADSHGHAEATKGPAGHTPHVPHESPAVMTWPLIILAACAIALGFIGTPQWPWFQQFLGDPHGESGFTAGMVKLMLASSVIVLGGIGLGWWFYGRKPMEKADAPDPLAKPLGDVYQLLQNKYWIDELYDQTVVAFNRWFAKVCDFFDTWIWNGVVQLVSFAVLGLSWLNRFVDEFIVNLGFDGGCGGVRLGGKIMSRLQDGRVQNYLRVIGIALTALVLALLWGCRS